LNHRPLVEILVITAPIDEGMARLSWPGWLVKYLSGTRNCTRTRSPIPVLTRPNVG